MDDYHVDVVKENKNVASIFTLFSDLTGEKNQNPRHCLKLIKVLLGNQFSVGSGSNLDYSIKRIVRGLGSTRLHSQCGCFASLACVLKYQACSIENVLDALEKEHKPVQGATKSEIKALHTGCVLTCGAIIHSGLFNSQPADIQDTILKKLIEAGKKKSYLSTVINQFLVDVVNLSDEQKFKNVVWPVCKSEILQNLEVCSADAYYLLLICQEKNGKLLNKFLQKNSTSPEDLADKIMHCLLNSCIKCDHPLYEKLGQFFCQNLPLLDKLWVKYVNENAKINEHKDTVLVILFSHIIKNLSDGTIVPKLLVPKLIEVMLKVLSFKKSKGSKDDCFTITKAALNSMVTLLCSQETSDKTRFESVKKLLFYPANMKFEMKTGTKCIHSLVSHLNGDFTKHLANIYRQLVNGELPKKVDEDGTEEQWNSKEKQYALFVFTKTLNHPALKQEISWKLEQIKFIFEIGFLKRFQLPVEVEKCAKDCFYKAVMVQMPSLKDLVTFLDELALHLNKNIRNKNLKLSEEVIDLWNKMFTTLETLKKKSHKLFVAVHVLLIYMGLQIFVDSELARNGIEELLSCYRHLKEVHKKKRVNCDDEGPHWTEVTVDLILSLLSRENRLWRHVVSCIFPQVVTQITPTALHQIIDALDPKSQANVLRHLNSDDSEAEDQEEEEEEEEGGSDSSSSEMEESDLEEADDEGKPNDQLRLAVRNALGFSAALTDDESADMDDMDEEEERRLNESLAAAFRQFRNKSQAKKKKQTKEEEALTHFRLRVLDLIEIYIANSPSMGGCLDLILPLLDILETSIKDHHQQPLQTRVDSILKQLSIVKNFSNVENVNQTVISDVFRSVVARKDTPALIFVEMSPRISDFATFLVRCSQSITSDDDEVPLADEFDCLLKAFFQSRDHKLPISIFQGVLRTTWKGNFNVAMTLLQLLTLPNIRIFKKMKIIELLRIFYKNDRLHSSCDKALMSELNNMEINFINNFINLLLSYGNQESKSTEKMQLSFYSNIIVLINVIQTCSKKHRREIKKSPPWKNVVVKMAEMEIINSNKKTRCQLKNLANLVNVALPAPEKAKRKRAPSESSAQENAQAEESEPKKKKPKKKISAEKLKLKKESRRLREEISSNGLDLVRFSAFDSLDLRDDEEVEEEDEVAATDDEQEVQCPKKKTHTKGDINGLSLSGK